MKNIQCICNWCNKEFLAESKEVNRGGGKFCSLSCSASHQNTSKNLLTMVCKFCKIEYTTYSKHSLYCSKRCSRKARHDRAVKSGNNKLSNRTTLQRKVIRLISSEEFKCFNCGWNYDVCDIHHLKPKSKGGTDDFNNLTVLCPNCHRLADRKKLINLPSVSERYRTISSSK